ncbi:MAG: WG repeat-containing protein [Phycisphaerae bacterium]
MIQRALCVYAMIASGVVLALAQGVPAAPSTSSAPSAAPASSPAIAPAGRLFMVKKDGLYGFIDATGKIVIEPKFPMTNKPPCSIDSFSDGMARVMVETNKWGYIDRTGKFAIEPQFEYCDRFVDGLAPVRDRHIRKFGYIDRTGRMVISAQFDAAWPFSEGLAMYQVAREGGERQNKFGFIDHKGNIVIKPFPADDVGYYFHEGMLRFRMGEHHGYIDKTGKVVIEPTLKVALDFSEGVAVAGKEYTKLGFIDKAGNWVVEPKFRALTNLSEGLAGYAEGAYKWGFVDKKGDVAIKAKWTGVGTFKEGLASVRIDPPENVFKEGPGMISMEIKSPPKFGFIDPTGKMVIPAQYDSVEAFDGGLSRVQVDKKFGYIDRKGNMVWAPSE